MMETRLITRLNVEIKNQNREVRLKYDLTSFDLRALIFIKPRDFFVMTWYSSFQPFDYLLHRYFEKMVDRKMTSYELISLASDPVISNLTLVQTIDCKSVFMHIRGQETVP